MEYILASASPRRKELLGLVLDDFKILPALVDETLPSDIPADMAPEYLALKKARAIALQNKNAVIIGADTIVLLDGKILGKPKNIEQARRFIKMLSGKTHKVITGCAVIFGDKCEAFSVCTEVEFFKLAEQEIAAYVNTNEGLDKAGAYGIQGKGALLIKGIRGDYFNVVGLPVSSLSRCIKRVVGGEKF